jgi:AAA+ ATPase superfamily predicted ATPase
LISAGVGVFASLLTTAYQSFQELSKISLENVSHAIEESRILPSLSKKYISRNNLESELLLNIKSPFGLYSIIYGPKGVGKSELVANTFTNKEGVVSVMVSSGKTKNDIILMLFRKLCGYSNDKVNNLEPEFLIDAVKNCKVIPTFIFDVDRSGSRASGLYAVRSVAKMLSPFSNCFIIMEEPTDILDHNGRDDDRERFIYVDDLTEAEAREFLESKNVTLTDEQIQYTFNNIGTRATMLRNLVREAHDETSLKKFVEKKLEWAKSDLVSSSHHPILKALKDHPDGISPEYFHHQKYRGVDLSDPYAVGVSLNDSNVLCYRVELGLYKLMSKAHYNALKSYEPTIYSQDFSV